MLIKIPPPQYYSFFIMAIIISLKVRIKLVKGQRHDFENRNCWRSRLQTDAIWGRPDLQLTQFQNRLLGLGAEVCPTSGAAWWD